MIDINSKIANEIKVYKGWSDYPKIGTFNILDAYLDRFTAGMAKLTAKAVKLGCLPVKTVKVATYDVVVEIDEVKVAITKHRIVLYGQRIKLGDWQFLAAIDHTDDGNLIRKLPGCEIEIPVEYRTAKPHCDHCKTLRYRKVSYLVTDGKQIKQVGSNCVADFTGHSAAKLAFMCEWFEQARGLAQLGEDMDRAGRGSYKYHTATFLALVSKSIREDGWVSRTMAGSWTPATADRAWFDLTDPTKKDIVPAEEDVELAGKVIEWGKGLSKTKEPLSDYHWNLATALSSDYINSKLAGVVASGINAYRNWQEQQAAMKLPAQPEKDSEFVGKVGDRQPFILTVVKAPVIEGFYGPKTIATMVDADQNVVVWFASGALNLEAGDRVVGKGTIKDHSTYKGIKQTVITRFNWDWAKGFERNA